MNHDPDRGSRRVLLVDDDDELRDVMATCLRRAGFDVTAVATGADAIAAAGAVQPLAAVIDLLLPDAGGYGLAEALRREHGLESIPVLFTTALSLQAVQQALPRAAVLFKPFKRYELVSAVTSLFPLGQSAKNAVR